MTKPLDDLPEAPVKPWLFFGKTLWLCMVYAAALMLIAAAVEAQNDPSGVAQINFAYRVF